MKIAGKRKLGKNPGPEGDRCTKSTIPTTTSRAEGQTAAMWQAQNVIHETFEVKTAYLFVLIRGLKIANDKLQRLAEQL